MTVYFTFKFCHWFISLVVLEREEDLRRNLTENETRRSGKKGGTYESSSDRRILTAVGEIYSGKRT